MLRNIKKFIQTRPGLITLFVVIILIGLLLLIFLIDKDEDEIETPDLIPEVSLEFVDTEPEQGTVQLSGTQNSIVVLFTEKVDPNTVKVSSIPQINFKILPHPDPTYYNSIILQPTEFWKNEKYKITIKKGVTSVTDIPTTLEEDIILEFTAIPFSLPRYDRPP